MSGLNIIVVFACEDRFFQFFMFLVLLLRWIFGLFFCFAAVESLSLCCLPCDGAIALPLLLLCDVWLPVVLVVGDGHVRGMRDDHDESLTILESFDPRSWRLRSIIHHRS